MLECKAVMVVGSQVPNLLEPGAAATLVVSEELDVGVPVHRRPELKEQLDELHSFAPSPGAPSVWSPLEPGLLALRFAGIDVALRPRAAYVLADERLPLPVLGSLSLLSAGARVEVEGTRLLLPRPAGLFLEKLITDRTGDDRERDLLVAFALLVVAGPGDLDEVDRSYRTLPEEQRRAARSNLELLSHLAARSGMPDPTPRRAALETLHRRLRSGETDPG